MSDYIIETFDEFIKSKQEEMYEDLDDNFYIQMLYAMKDDTLSQFNDVYEQYLEEYADYDYNQEFLNECLQHYFNFCDFLVESYNNAEEYYDLYEMLNENFFKKMKEKRDRERQETT